MDSDISEIGLLPLLGQFDWLVILDQWASIGTVILISSISIMLTVSALERLTEKDFDINKELRVSGFASLRIRWRHGQFFTF